MRVKAKRFEVASAVQMDGVGRTEEGRCSPAAAPLHLQRRLMARRQFLHLHQFPFAQHWHPGGQRISSKEFRNNRSYFARPFPLEGSEIPRKAATFTNFHLCPNGGICLCSHLFFSPPLSLSTTFPRYYPPFFVFLPEQGAQ